LEEKKKELLRKKILPNNFISKQEEGLLFKLPFWIIRDKEMRREWTRKISKDLDKLPKLLWTEPEVSNRNRWTEIHR
jgi:hypothetical protein